MILTGKVKPYTVRWPKGLIRQLYSILLQFLNEQHVRKSQNNLKLEGTTFIWPAWFTTHSLTTQAILRLLEFLWHWIRTSECGNSGCHGFPKAVECPVQSKSEEVARNSTRHQLPRSSEITCLLAFCNTIFLCGIWINILPAQISKFYII